MIANNHWSAVSAATDLVYFFCDPWQVCIGDWKFESLVKNMEKGKVHLSKRTQIVLYGLSLALLVFLLKWLEFRFLILNHSQEIFTGIVALVFTGLGI